MSKPGACRILYHITPHISYCWSRLAWFFL